MTDAIGALMGVLVAMAVLGEAGKRLAKDRGISPWQGFLIGALLPLVGVGALLLVKKVRRNARHGG